MRVNVDDSLFADGRLSQLSKLLGENDEEAALGALVKVWFLCSKLRQEILTESQVIRAGGWRDRLPEAMIGADLAEKLPAGLRIRGVAERIAYLLDSDQRIQEARIAGGKKRAEGAAREGGRFKAVEICNSPPAASSCDQLAGEKSPAGPAQPASSSSSSFSSSFNSLVPSKSFSSSKSFNSEKVSIKDPGSEEKAGGELVAEDFQSSAVPPPGISSELAQDSFEQLEPYRDLAPVKKRAPRGKQVGKSVPSWERYQAAFLARYGVEPLRNVEANALLCRLVDKVGAENAPEVAAYYLNHSDRQYLQAKHPLSLLVRDAQKVYTDWKAKTQTTSVKAQQDESSQHNAQVVRNYYERTKGEFGDD